MGKVSSLRHLDKEAGTPKTHSKPLKAVILLLGFYLAQLTEIPEESLWKSGRNIYVLRG